MKKIAKDVTTAPTAKISIPMNSVNCEKMDDNPEVKILPDAFIPEPIFLLKSNRKSVEATLIVGVTTTIVVCNFLRKRLFTGKAT
jgi:hypothetical protein